MSAERPNHVPFWPWLVGFAFLVAVVVAGTIASDAHRRSTGEVARSTTSSVAPPSSAASSTECSGPTFVAALEASGYVTPALAADLRPTRVRCLEGYAYAFFDVAKPKEEQTSEVYFQLTGGAWKVLDAGAVGDGTDVGLPPGLGARLRSS